MDDLTAKLKQVVDYEANLKGGFGDGNKREEKDIATLKSM